MKRILSFLYILLIAGVTFFLVPVYQVKGSTKFLKDHRDLFESSHLDLISGTTLAFRNNGTSVHIEKDPIFSENYVDKLGSEVINQFDLNFYSVIEKKGKTLRTGMYVIIDNVLLSDIGNNFILDDEGRYLIRFQMFFNKPIEINGKEIEESTDIFIPLYDGKSGVLFFEQSFLKDADGFVEIEKILLSVKTKDDNVENLLTLTDKNYDGKIESDIFQDGNKDISEVTSERINLLNRVDANDLNNNENIYYNSNLAKTFKSKYNYFPFFIVIWFFIVTAITYFLFAHKYVKLRLEEKKKLKDLEFEKIKEDIKSEEKK